MFRILQVIGSTYMIIERLEVGVFAENCYIVGCEQTKAGFVIDPGDEVPEILKKIDALGLDIKSVLITHAHIDHVKELYRFKQIINVPILMHKDDQFLLDSLKMQAAAFGLSVSGVPQVNQYVTDGQLIELGKYKFEILHTPGHSPGSVSFKSDEVVFVGDVLFSGSIGRTDLPGGNFEILINSIKSKLLPLGNEMIVYPGHGPSTTIGQEKNFNPFLTGMLNN